MTVRTLAAAVVVSVAAAGGSAAFAATAAGTHTPAQTGESVCPNFTTGHLSPTGSYTAPDGFLISAVCVKAGSDIQGDGPEITNYDPPVESVTIAHSSGKDVSHFSVLLVPEVPPSTTTTTTPPQCPNPPCIPDTQATTSTTTPAISTSSTTTEPSSSTTTSSTAPPTTNPPSDFTFGAALTECQAEIPTIVINFRNLFPDLAGQTGTLTMSDINGNVISEQSLVYQPGTTVELLYPGTSVNPDGTIADVPGWNLNDDGFWVRDPSDEFLREGINLSYTVNPTATAFVTYPPESSACANPDGPFGPPPVTPRLPATR